LTCCHRRWPYHRHGDGCDFLQANQQMANMLGAPHTASAPSQQATSNAIAGMSPKQLYDILKLLKAQIEANPEKGRAVLAANLPLAKALFQAQILLGMVNPEPDKPEPAAAAQPEPAAPSAQAGPGATNGSAQPAAALPQHDPKQIGTPLLRCLCVLARRLLRAVESACVCRFSVLMQLL
jgi:Hinge domain of cleavage stimulation factor subunit 2